MRRILTIDAIRILRVDRKTLYHWGDQGIVSVRREKLTGTRTYDRDEIAALAKTLPRKRAKNFKLIKPK